ncbi:helix-turn-helix domain-containing protein, partial [uncultured Dialister sp.]|uniref:helix-turn-helix domain-containing protein n=1 Tax=uncultured Dialister sp. TaxID=278064 RepID=UPI00266F5D20
GQTVHLGGQAVHLLRNTHMATEKEILLCFQNGDSQRRIASSLKVSRNTVFRIVSAYMAQELEASDVFGLTSEALHGQYELLELT